MLDTGVVRWRVVPAAGHSVGQIALFEDRSRALIAGDAILASDVAWINPFLDGAAALEVAIATLERIGLLDAHVAVAGRGEVIEDVVDCIKGSLERLRRWRQEPADGLSRVPAHLRLCTHDPWRISPLPT